MRVAPGAGPRLTNTFINGTALGLFEEVVEPLARSVAWLRFVLQLIHTELVRAFSRWAQQNPSSRLPRISLLCALQASVFSSSRRDIRCGNALCDRQNTELSESLIETKVDILEDLATATEQEAVADDSDTSCAHPLSRPRSATRLLLERRRTVKKRALRSGWRIIRDCSR